MRKWSNKENTPIDADSYSVIVGLKIRTTCLNVLCILFCDFSNGIDYFCEKWTWKFVFLVNIVLDSAKF
jgi:hypothetical protein